MIFERIQSHGHRDVRLMTSLDEAREVVEELAQPGDIVITMGAGDVNRICRKLAGQSGSKEGRVVQRVGRKKGRGPIRS